MADHSEYKAISVAAKEASEADYVLLIGLRDDNTWETVEFIYTPSSQQKNDKLTDWQKKYGTIATL